MSASGSRLPILSVGHTGITVSDLDRSVAFYRDVMGFPVTETIRLGGELVAQVTGLPEAEIDIVFVTAPGHTIELLSYVKPEDRARSTLRPCDPGFFHLCFMVDDIDRVVETVGAAGFEPAGPVPTVQHGPKKGRRAIYTRDPDGVVLEFMEDPKGEG
ncbi:MAG: bleomycin resistance protein [Streptosporangiales bacterium]|nr:bleomycin resistance protein [Streptosporangiales bacterium]